MTRQARSIRCPESVLGWIPWYAEHADDGRPLLDPRQRGAVEAHASECADCRAELDMIAGAPYRIDFEIPDPDRVFDEITARIDAGEAEGRDTAPALPSDEASGFGAAADPRGDRRLSDAELTRLEDWVFDPHEEAALAAEAQDEDASPVTVIRGPWTSPGVRALAVAAVFVLGLALGGLLDGERPWAASVVGLDGAYVSAAATASTAADEAPLIDVVFTQARTMEEVARALRAVGAEIVSGPSSVGRYRVRLDPGRLSASDASAGVSADVAAITARLKAGPDPIALYAEPVLQ